MKYIKFLLIVGVLPCLFACEQKLPYPLKETVRSVAIDIAKTPGTDMTLSAGVTTDNISLTLNIPWQQGDYSMMKEAEVMCVYAPMSGGTKIAMVQTGITSFPAVVSVNMGTLCSALGVSSPSIGDRMTFVPNVVLNNGMTIPGYIQETGVYNNAAFSGWEVDFGSARYFSYRAQYVSFAPFYQEKYQGVVTCVENGSPYSVLVTPLPSTDLPPTMPAGATPSDLYGMLVDGFWDDGCFLKVWINKLDFSLIIPAQKISNGGYDYGGLDRDFWFIGINAGSADVNTSTNVISFATRIEISNDNYTGPSGLGWARTFELRFGN